MQVIPQNSVCAVVVTFHPRSSDIENMRIVRGQVQELVVIDNGSSQPELEKLRSVKCEESFELIENGENLGIAAALNVGVS
jgi:rhamnosyltransferase